MLNEQKENYVNTLKEFLKLSNGNELNIQYPIEIKDKDGNVVYTENSYGFWIKREFDSKGNQTYSENSNGYWCKSEFDSRGNETYYEDSYGHKEGTSKNSIKELTVEQIQNELGYKIKIVE